MKRYLQEEIQSGWKADPVLLPSVPVTHLQVYL